MDIVPRMGRAERRELIRIGRKSGDPAAALRPFVDAKLGQAEDSPRGA